MSSAPAPSSFENLPLRVSPEVKEAQSLGKPIVALESTIITHGMPYPQNLQVAREVESVVRQGGAVPATLAVLKGEICIGLMDPELEALAQAKDVRKLSRADLALALVQKADGATTVAATMILARLAGIDVFATGGIGGVHRGAEESFDISADLQELAQTSVTVVAAGAKAILDIPKTLEVLETLGVPVLAYGQESLPAFWSATSNLKAPAVVQSASEIAQAHQLRAALGVPGGQLIANPVPHADEIPAHELEPLIAQALQEAEAQKIMAKAVTPFLLQRIFELTEGRSLVTNIALVKNNARLAAEIATEIATELGALRHSPAEKPRQTL
ncbi:MAG: pseudouridine-5'-phosphate glycosidase [Pseudomonadota bacterium]